MVSRVAESDEKTRLLAAGKHGFFRKLRNGGGAPCLSLNLLLIESAIISNAPVRGLSVVPRIGEESGRWVVEK